MVCRSSAPACDACPVAASCRWRRAGHPEPRDARRPAPAFERTARFARGRIVEALRAGPAVSASALAAALPAEHAARIDVYLAALERDGLIESTPDGWALPGYRATGPDGGEAAGRMPMSR
jgi:A/G-specific adenine glycosylase